MSEDKLCIDCEYNDLNPCKPCYENEHILGWHYYFKKSEKRLKDV